VSSRSQQLARIPWEEIESEIDKKTENNERAKPSRIIMRRNQKLRYS
jgi:hypothetical protein